jgi:hypothetical protein
VSHQPQHERAEGSDDRDIAEHANLLNASHEVSQSCEPHATDFIRSAFQQTVAGSPLAVHQARNDVRMIAAPNLASLDDTHIDAAQVPTA